MGNTQCDPASKRIYLNVQDRRELVAIDPASDAVVENNDPFRG
jgi:hypothetical protein